MSSWTSRSTSGTRIGGEMLGSSSGSLFSTYVTSSIYLACIGVDLVLVDCYDLSLHVFIPHEAVEQIAVVQQGEATSCF